MSIHVKLILAHSLSLTVFCYFQALSELLNHQIFSISVHISVLRCKYTPESNQAFYDHTKLTFTLERERGIFETEEAFQM